MSRICREEDVTSYQTKNFYVYAAYINIRMIPSLLYIYLFMYLFTYGWDGVLFHEQGILVGFLGAWVLEGPIAHILLGVPI